MHSQDISLTIHGKDSAETAIIDSLAYSKSFKDYKSLHSELKLVIDRLQKKGFIECELIKNSKINDSTYHSKIELKRRFHTIYIYTPKKLISEALLKKFSNKVTDDYFVIPISKLETVMQQLNAEIVIQGNPFSTIKLINVSKKDESNISAELSIEDGKARTLDGIIVKGYEAFPRSFLKHYLRLKSNSIFNLDRTKEKTEALNNLTFANQVKSPEVLFTTDSTKVYLYLEKTKSNTFDGFLGFGTSETTGKIEFDGYLNLRLVNNLNYGESFFLTYKSDESEQRTFTTELKLPYIFNSPIGTNLKLNIFKKDSTFTNVDQVAGLYYDLSPKQSIQAEISYTTSNSSTDNTFENLDDYTSTFLHFNYHFKKQDFTNKLFTTNAEIRLKLGTGNRKTDVDNLKQRVYGLTASKLFFLNRRNSIYLNVTSAGLFSEDYLLNELFRFGGINSIRGFEENSLRASMYGVFNTEYRYSLSETIYIHSIFDAGYFENDLNNLKTKLFSFGVGFGIFTKAGLLKFNYANGKTEDQQFKLSDSKIHISLNTQF